MIADPALMAALFTQGPGASRRRGDSGPYRALPWLRSPPDLASAGRAPASYGRKGCADCSDCCEMGVNSHDSIAQLLYSV